MTTAAPRRPFRNSRVPGLLLAALLAVALSGCGVPGPNGPADTYDLDFSLPKDAQAAGAIIFAVDGINSDVFGEMLAAGELPTFQKYFIDRGLYVPRAVGNLPTVTLANFTSVITGQFPGHTNITGINWFDRNQLIWRDYSTIAQKNTLDGDYTPATLYEQFPDETTWSIFFQPHRGATKFVENRTSGGPPFFLEWFDLVDRLTLSRLDMVADIARKQNRFPAVTVLYLLSADFMAYRHGVSSAEYRQALRNTDRNIGRVLGDLQRAGLLDRLHIVLVSDHGHLDIKRHFPMDAFLRDEVGLKLDPGQWWEKDPFERRLQEYENVTVVPYGSGDRFYALCLRRPKRQDGRLAGWEPWIVRPATRDLAAYPAVKNGAAYDVNLVEVLLKQDAVDVVAYADGPDRVRICRRNGQVEFRQDGGRHAAISCRVLAGTDPLGYKGKVPDNALAGRPQTSRQWLDATAGTDYPDLPAQILAYFRSRHAGDIAVFAMPGWDFNHRNLSGHGGVRAGDFQVPLLIAGPGVPHRRLDVARTVDLMPTILTLLGRPLPENLDGLSLVKPRPAAVQSRP